MALERTPGRVWTHGRRTGGESQGAFLWGRCSREAGLIPCWGECTSLIWRRAREATTVPGHGVGWHRGCGWPHSLWPRSCSGLVCVHTCSWSGLAFVLPQPGLGERPYPTWVFCGWVTLTGKPWVPGPRVASGLRLFSEGREMPPTSARSPCVPSHVQQVATAARRLCGPALP